VKPTLALSTAWCSHRHSDGYTMLREIADLGFEYVELSHGIRIVLVPGIIKALAEGVIKIGSTHNFCLLPTGVNQAAPNLFEPSSADAREQDQWVRHTKRSIDLGAQLGSGILVCHLGSVVFFWFNPARRLQARLRDDKPEDVAGDKDYQALLSKSVSKLRARMPAYWDRTKKNVGKVLDYAAKNGVRLGFENREKFEELPVDADFPEFIAGLPPGSPAGYWHDTGHAEIKRSMGLIDPFEQLAKNSERIIGFHLHDVNDEGQDHQPIGSGHVDFERVSTFWRPEHHLVLELGPRTTTGEVITSRARMEEVISRWAARTGSG
jgi:sugar phosphate isomerase/epimerase